LIVIYNNSRCTAQGGWGSERDTDAGALMLIHTALTRRLDEGIRKGFVYGSRHSLCASRILAELISPAILATSSACAGDGHLVDIIQEDTNQLGDEYLIRYLEMESRNIAHPDSKLQRIILLLK
jgi:hypothetical protein